MALPKAAIDPQGTRWKVHYDREWQEWQVRAYKKSPTGAWKFWEGPTYYTEDREDAIRTFNYLITAHTIGKETPAGFKLNPHDARHSLKLAKQVRAVIKLRNLVEDYGMASVGSDGTIRWLDGGVTHCGKNNLRTAVRIAADKTIRHAQKHGMPTKKLFLYWRAAGF
jgi:hypothetical protein